MSHTEFFSVELFWNSTTSHRFCSGLAMLAENRNFFSEIDRWIRCQKEQRLYLHFRMGWICGPKFTSLKYVPAANPWIALSFSAIKIGVVIRIS